MVRARLGEKQSSQGKQLGRLSGITIEWNYCERYSFSAFTIQSIQTQRV